MKCMYCDTEKEAIGFVYKDGTFHLPACEECSKRESEDIEIEFEDMD